MKDELRAKIIKIATYALTIGLITVLLVIIKAWVSGKFHDVKTFQDYIAGYGSFGPVILVLFQAAQVIIPILPGFLGCAVGSVMFGIWGGFWCNFIGIAGGSIIAFVLAKKFGKPLVRDLFKPETYEKWEARANNSKSFDWFIFVAMLLPLFPDDLLCYISGLTDMTLKKFTLIIILGKPWCLLAYSFGFGMFV